MTTETLEDKKTSLKFCGLDQDQLAVNMDERSMTGVAIIEKGQTKDLRFNIDDDFLDAVVKKGNKPKKGLRSRYKHPEFFEDALGKLIAKYKNFRREGDVVRADFFGLESSKLSPDFLKDPVEYVLSLAKETPEEFGNSIVMEWDFKEDLPEGGIRVHPFDIKLINLEASDIVGDPAATSNGIFSQNPLKENQMDKKEKDKQEADLSQVKKDSQALGEKGSKDLFAALTKEFEGEAEFVAEQFSKGATLEEARADFKDEELKRLKADNEKLTAEKSELSKKVAQEKADKDLEGPEVAALETDETETGDDGETKVKYSGLDRRHAIASVMKDKNCTWKTALKILKVDKPEIFA